MSSTVSIGLAVTSHNDALLGTAQFDSVDLALPWNSADTGSQTNPGTTGYDPTTGTFTFNAAGSGLGNTSDSFRFGYASLNGDGEIQARLLDFQNASASSFGGLSLRSSLSEDSPHVTFSLAAGGVGWLTTRAAAGGSSDAVSLGAISAPPQWVKLVRRTDEVRIFISTDGINWRWLGTSHLGAGALNSQVFAGMIASSGDNASFTQVRFDQLSALPLWTNQDIGSLGFLGSVSHDLSTSRKTSCRVRRGLEGVHRMAAITQRAVRNVTVTLDETGAMVVQCDAVALATRYRFRMLLVGIQTEYQLAARSTEPVGVISDVMPGQTVQIIVQAVNGNLQGVASDPVVFTVPLPAARTAEAAPMITPVSPEVAAVPGNGGRNGHAELSGARA